MPQGLFLGLVLIPSMLFAFVVLATFYGVNKAYLGISWLPITSAVLIWLFEELLQFQQLPTEWWHSVGQTIGWACLVQAALGVVLIIRSFYIRKDTITLIFATSAVASPFLFSWF